MCAAELKRLKECEQGTMSVKGYKLACLLENTESIGPGQCKAFLVKVGSIIFSDYRFLDRFVTACKEDVSRLSCGRLGTEEEGEGHRHKEQGSVQGGNNAAAGCQAQVGWQGKGPSWRHAGSPCSLDAPQCF